MSGPIKAWKNISDVELVWIHNHTGSRKRLAGVDEAAQTFVLRPPYVLAVPPESFCPGAQHPLPSIGKACYFENALEMLSQPGEWYLDRRSGVLSYWPRAGEDLAQAEVVAPRVQKTLIAVTGLRERPVRNLHFNGNPPRVCRLSSSRRRALRHMGLPTVDRPARPDVSTIPMDRFSNAI